MKQVNLCLLGFGNVGRALVELLLAKREEVREHYGIEWRITGVATRSIGWLAWPEGLDGAGLLSGEISSRVPQPANIDEWLSAAQADLLFELTSLNPLTGEPAISHVRAALERGSHVVTANKGPLAHAYHELKCLAEERGRRFMFEATAAHCLPIFSLFRENLPAAGLLGFSGILNSTTNIILEEMERGRTFSEGVESAQALGITEADPSYDVDGFDAAVKVCAIANVLMGARLRLEEIKREGIRGLEASLVRSARSEGRPFKLVARAGRAADGQVTASVRPEQVPLSHPFATVSGSSLIAHFELDVLRGLSLIAHRPDLRSTAYGLLADFINVVR
jgi:homoserine dehydrogenase